MISTNSDCIAKNLTDCNSDSEAPQSSAAAAIAVNQTCSSDSDVHYAAAGSNLIKSLANQIDCTEDVYVPMTKDEIFSGIKKYHKLASCAPAGAEAAAFSAACISSSCFSAAFSSSSFFPAPSFSSGGMKINRNRECSILPIKGENGCSSCCICCSNHSSDLNAKQNELKSIDANNSSSSCSCINNRNPNDFYRIFDDNKTLVENSTNSETETLTKLIEFLNKIRKVLETPIEQSTFSNLPKQEDDQQRRSSQAASAAATEKAILGGISLSRPPSQLTGFPETWNTIESDIAMHQILRSDHHHHFAHNSSFHTNNSASGASAAPTATAANASNASTVSAASTAIAPFAASNPFAIGVAATPIANPPASPIAIPSVPIEISSVPAAASALDPVTNVEETGCNNDTAVAEYLDSAADSNSATDYNSIILMALASCLRKNGGLENPLEFDYDYSEKTQNSDEKIPNLCYVPLPPLSPSLKAGTARAEEILTPHIHGMNSYSNDSWILEDLRIINRSGNSKYLI